MVKNSTLKAEDAGKVKQQKQVQKSISKPRQPILQGSIDLPQKPKKQIPDASELKERYQGFYSLYLSLKDKIDFTNIESIEYIQKPGNRQDKDLSRPTKYRIVKLKGYYTKVGRGRKWLSGNTEFEERLYECYQQNKGKKDLRKELKALYSQNSQSKNPSTAITNMIARFQQIDTTNQPTKHTNSNEPYKIIPNNNINRLEEGIDPYNHDIIHPPFQTEHSMNGGFELNTTIENHVSEQKDFQQDSYPHFEKNYELEYQNELPQSIEPPFFPPQIINLALNQPEPNQPDILRNFNNQNLFADCISEQYNQNNFNDHLNSLNCAAIHDFDAGFKICAQNDNLTPALDHSINNSYDWEEYHQLQFCSPFKDNLIFDNDAIIDYIPQIIDFPNYEDCYKQTEQSNNEYHFDQMQKNAQCELENKDFQIEEEPTDKFLNKSYLADSDRRLFMEEQ